MYKKEKVKIILLLIGMIVLMAGLWLVLRQLSGSEPASDMAMSNDNIFADDVLAETEEPKGTIKLDGEKYNYYHDFETYLFMGTDASGNEEAEGDDYRGSMADFLLLIVLDKTDDTYGFIQFNRDTITKIRMLGRNGKGAATGHIQLCTAHWYGGTKEQSCENTVDAVSDLLGKLPIDGYYSLTMDAIAQLNHAVGGVEVTIEDDFSKVDKSLTQNETILLTDEQAYTFIHDRFNVGDEDNISRMRRQNQYMKKFLEKAKQMADEDPTFVNRLYQQLQDVAVTDITGRQLSRMTKSMSEGENTGIRQIEGTSKVGRVLGDGIDHAEFYIDPDSLVDVMTDLYGLKPVE